MQVNHNSKSGADKVSSVSKKPRKPFDFSTKGGYFKSVFFPAVPPPGAIATAADGGQTATVAIVGAPGRRGVGRASTAVAAAATTSPPEPTTASPAPRTAPAGGASGQAPEHSQQKGTTAHAEHQQRVLRSPRLHTERAVRHEAVQNQNAPVGHFVHRLPDDRAGRRRPGHRSDRFQSRPVHARVVVQTVVCGRGIASPKRQPQQSDGYRHCCSPPATGW